MDVAIIQNISYEEQKLSAPSLFLTVGMAELI